MHTTLEPRLDQALTELAAVKAQLADLADAHRTAALTDGINALRNWAGRPHLDPGLEFAIGVLTSLRDDLDQPAPTASAVDPTPLRWGLNDVLWGDDDTVTVMLSGPDGEPYWLELDPERASVLREDLAGPDGKPTA